MSSESFRDIEPHSFYLETCGCAKNSVDSENLIALLSQNGLVHTTDADAADVLIVNTCGFIDDAKKESVAVFTDLRERYPDKKLAVTGCLAQRYENELKKTGAADLFIGNRSIRKTAEAVLRLAGTEVVVPGALFYERNFFFSFTLKLPKDAKISVRFVRFRLSADELKAAAKSRLKLRCGR